MLLKLFLYLIFIQYKGLCFEADSKKIVSLNRNNYLSQYVEFDKEYSFVVLQAHSKYENNTVSMNQDTQYGESYEALHSGIIKRSFDNNEIIAYFKSSNTRSLKAMLLAVPVPQNHPIPGGCCLTCALENDPNLQISYSKYKTTLRFSRASKYYNPYSSPDCDGSEKPASYDLAYSVYYTYLKENDFSEENLFDSLFEMSTPSRIKSKGKLLTTIDSSSNLVLEMETIFAQGIVLNVIVSDKKYGSSFETAYVPTAVYACNFKAKAGSPESCLAKGSTTVLVFCLTFGIVGMVLVFAGFKLFKFYVLCCGTGFYWFWIFIVMSRYLNPSVESSTDTLIVAFMSSFLGGGFTLFLYAFTKSFYLIVLPKICLFFGFFISSIIFYTPFGALAIWSDDYKFLLAFASIALLCSFVGIFFPKAMCYLSSSMMGSYAVVMIPNYYMRGNMQYIILTVVNRVVVPEFGYLYLGRVFAENEYILTGVWGFLFLLGLTIQYCTTKDEPFYYSGKALRQKLLVTLTHSMKLARNKKRGNRGNTIQPVTPREYQRSPPPQERAPLLHSRMPDNYDSFGEPHSYGGLNHHFDRFGGDCDTPSTNERTINGNASTSNAHHTRHQTLIIHQQSLIVATAPPYASSSAKSPPATSAHYASAILSIQRPDV